jgi:N-acetylglucosaminyl-diphospho-decaprenol L-rhamnosyltransferase
MPTLAIIIVSWNVRDLLDRCIVSLHASLAGSAIAYEIVVADNASSDGTAQMLRERHPEVRLIETGGNRGFGGGNNIAMRAALAGPEPPELLLILNPDTEAVGEAIPTLVSWMLAHADVAVAGPLLRYPDGSAQPSRRRLPTAGVFFMESTPLEWRWPENRWVRRYRMLDQPELVEQDVEWLVGAALLVRRSAIAQAGMFDERFSLYSEELEWQRRLRRAGRIVFLPQAVITHHEGQSSAQVPTRRLVLFHTNRLRYIRMAHGAPLALLVRAFLLAAYGAELLLEGGKWLIGHRRDLRAQRVGAYAALLRALVAG